MHIQDFATIAVVSRTLVAIGWVGFFFFFALRRTPANQGETKRAPVSRVGIGLQMLSFALVWMLQRKLPLAVTPLSATEVTLDLLAPILSIVSAWFGLSAVRTLGRQWSYTARLVQDHALVTDGPYRVVRHPIYTAMLGKLLATSFAFGHWLGLVVALPIYIAGTQVRIRSEERLLREAFGAEYEAYSARVPSFVPFLG